jgi:hypothetical protein
MAETQTAAECTIHKGYIYWQVRNAAEEIVCFAINEQAAETVVRRLTT